MHYIVSVNAVVIMLYSYLASDACSCSRGLIFSSTAEYVTFAFTHAASGAAAVLARLATCI